ncbi:hypothetical protein KP509_27G053700 [Ceratopteris richardii]|nr:hypothetical protein KP509_27G053700 [Ceratopteris richardii]
MGSVTPIEVAGLCVGAFIVTAALSAPRVDLYIAESQRRNLKLCLVCGGVKRVHCIKCKGRGHELPPWTSSMLSVWTEENMVESSSSAPCALCQGKGHFPCSSCAKEIK